MRFLMLEAYFPFVFIFNTVSAEVKKESIKRDYRGPYRTVNDMFAAYLVFFCPFRESVIQSAEK